MQDAQEEAAPQESPQQPPAKRGFWKTLFRGIGTGSIVAIAGFICFMAASAIFPPLLALPVIMGIFVGLCFLAGAILGSREPAPAAPKDLGTEVRSMGESTALSQGKGVDTKAVDALAIAGAQAAKVAAARAEVAARRDHGTSPTTPL